MNTKADETKEVKDTSGSKTNDNVKVSGAPPETTAQTPPPPPVSSGNGMQFLIVLVFIVLGMASLYFYDRQNRITEQYTALNSEFAQYKNDTAKLMNEYHAILQQVQAVSSFKESVQERINTLSENQRIDSSRVDDVIRHITVKERSETITELKKALLIIDGIGSERKKGKSSLAQKKLKNDIRNLIDQIARSGSSFETGEGEKNSAGELIITPRSKKEIILPVKKRKPAETAPEKDIDSQPAETEKKPAEETPLKPEAQKQEAEQEPPHTHVKKPVQLKIEPVSKNGSDKKADTIPEKHQDEEKPESTGKPVSE